MRLRIRHANGMATLSDITAEQTVLELKENIVKAIGLPSGHNIEISGGYPPKPISDDNISLKATGLRDGDTLNIKLLEKALPPPPQRQQQQQQQATFAPAFSNSNNNTDGCVETPAGFLTLRVMKDDNSCLFRSIGNYVLRRDTTISKELRQVIVNGIKEDPFTYSEVTLGQPIEKYIEWIQKPTAWGGAIELTIFSSHFGIEIDSIDVQTGRIDKFGEGSYDERVLIVYSGIHYDALALAPTSNSPTDFDQTRFSISDNYILDASKKLVDEQRKKHKFTDVANFTLKCEQCNTGLKGEKDAQDHASATGHTHFTEYQ